MKRSQCIHSNMSKLKFFFFIPLFSIVIGTELYSVHHKSFDSSLESECFLTEPKCNAGSKYRTSDGSCNNLKNPTWGMINTAFVRLFPPSYIDGQNIPPKGKDGSQLPNARELTVTLFPDKDLPDEDAALALVHFAQFAAHDIAETVPHAGVSNCCTSPDKSEWCMEIPVAENDPMYSEYHVKCLNFVRSASMQNCTENQPRQQINGVSHMFDASQIYGSNEEREKLLRKYSGGKLLYQLSPIRGKVFPPPHKPNNCFRSNICFVAGDDRPNQNVQLSVIHTLFLREHNRIAVFLSLLHPSWNDEILYQEARAIVIAEYQHMIYDHFVPFLLGEQFAIENGLKPMAPYHYNDSINFSVINSFSTAAFRIFHSGIQGILKMYNYRLDPVRNINISNYMASPDIVVAGTNFDQFILGQLTQRMQTLDEYITHQLDGMLFHMAKPYGTDLSAITIQRGRDHGLPKYTQVLHACTNVQINSFDDLHITIDEKKVEEIRKFYKSVHDIDLAVGGNLERIGKGEKLGPVYKCLVAEQFRRLKFGDRFWYEIQGQPHSLNSAQLREIRKASFSRIICDNSDEITRVPRDAFRPTSVLNPIVSCSEIPGIDLNIWQ